MPPNQKSIQSESIILIFHGNSSFQCFNLGGADWELSFNSGLSHIEFTNLSASANGIYRLETALRIAVVHPQYSYERELVYLNKVVFSDNNYHIDLGSPAYDYSEFVQDEMLKISISLGDSKSEMGNYAMEYIANLNNVLFQSALENGDISILCKDDKAVKADRNFLSQIPFFKSLFQFKENQISENNPNTADLSQFEEAAVSALVQFLYTGKFNSPGSLVSRMQLFRLAEYTLAESFSNEVLKLISKEGYDLKELIFLAATPI